MIFCRLFQESYNKGFKYRKPLTMEVVSEQDEISYLEEMEDDAPTQGILDSSSKLCFKFRLIAHALVYVYISIDIYNYFILFFQNLKKILHTM